MKIRDIISCINADNRKPGEKKKTENKGQGRLKSVTLIRQDLASAMKLTNSPVRSRGPSCRKEYCLIFLLCTWAKSVGGKINSHCLDNKNYQILNPGINPIAKTYESEKKL